MHFGLVAVRGSVADLRTAFTEVWSGLDVVASKDGFEDIDAFWDWMEEGHENPGAETYALCQDGPWAVLMDASYVLASDEVALEELSRRFGVALSFIVETAGGSAMFGCFEEGSLRRSIMTQDGTTEFKGDSMEQEEGIETAFYYMDETESLLGAFGMHRPDQLPRLDSGVALAVVDRTDHEDFDDEDRSGEAPEDSHPQDPSSTRTPAGVIEHKPWWKIW